MKRALVIIFLLFIIGSRLFSQVDSVYMGKPSDAKAAHDKKVVRSDAWKKKFTWGGNFQAWVGNPTFVFLSPTLGYIPFKNFSVGVGAIYNYTKIQYTYGSFSQSIFGGHSYMRYIIADSYFVQVQFDKLRQPNLLSLDPVDKVWVDYLLVGGGLRQAIGDKMALSTSVMYNLTPSPLSIYPNRIILQFGIVGSF